MQGRASVVEPDGAEPRPGQSFHRARRVSGGRIHGSQCRGGSRGARGQGSASVHPSRGSRLGTGSGGVMCGTPGTLARWTGSVRKVPQDPAGRGWWSTSLPRSRPRACRESSAEMVYIHPVLRDPREPSELATVPVVLAAQAEQGRDAAVSHRRVPGHQHSTRAGRRPTQPREAREAANRATAGRERPPRSGARQAAARTTLPATFVEPAKVPRPRSVVPPEGLHLRLPRRPGLPQGVGLGASGPSVRRVPPGRGEVDQPLGGAVGREAACGLGHRPEAASSARSARTSPTRAPGQLAVGQEDCRTGVGQDARGRRLLVISRAGQGDGDHELPLGVRRTFRGQG